LALIQIDKIGDYTKAISYAEDGAKKFPKDAKSQDLLGWVYYKKQKYPEALKQFQRAVRFEEKNPTYLYHLGLTHQKMGNKSWAKKAFEQALGMIDSKGLKAFEQELRIRIDQCD
jgi:tetratricopeptide (TPR) repeat protein